jgi:predicted  nucleic acid-binding Zn-ribbon protein
VASLEQKLASATSRQRRLAEENSRLREQLRAAEQSLAEAQDAATAEALAARFDSAEVLLLERLLSPLREARRPSPEADAG